MCYLRRIAKIRFLPVFQIWLTLRPKKNKKLLFYGHWTRYDLLRGRTSAFLIFRSFGHSYGRSRQKGRTCRRHAMTDFMSNVNTKSISATPALCSWKKDSEEMLWCIVLVSLKWVRGPWRFIDCIEVILICDEWIRVINSNKAFGTKLKCGAHIL